MRLILWALLMSSLLWQSGCGAMLYDLTDDGRPIPTTCEECATDSECEALCGEEY